MTHLYYIAATSIQTHSPSALLFAFVVGVVSSLGPCTPARLVWLTNAASGSRRPWAFIAAFVAGTVCLYASFALVGEFASVMLRYRPWIYALLGVTSIWFGIREVWHADHGHSHTASDVRKPKSLGAAFFQGLGFGALVQPCCTPVLFMVATTVAPTSVPYAVLVLLAFGIGHGLPAFAVGPATRFLQWIQTRGLSSTFAMAMGGISIGIGGYFLHGIRAIRCWHYGGSLSSSPLWHYSGRSCVRGSPSCWLNEA